MMDMGDTRSGFWQRLRPGKPAPPSVRREGVEAFLEGRHGDAEKLLVGALQRAERQAPGSFEEAQALVDLADLYRARARWDEAEPLFARAIALLERLRGAEHGALVKPLHSLALAYRAQGQYERAEPLCRRALAIAERAHGGEHPATAAALSNLLTVYLAQGRDGEAGPLFQRSVAIKERLLGPRHPDLASSLSTYAAFLRKTRGDAEAATWEARARAIQQQSGTPARR